MHLKEALIGKVATSFKRVVKALSDTPRRPAKTTAKSLPISEALAGRALPGVDTLSRSERIKATRRLRNVAGARASFSKPLSDLELKRRWSAHKYKQGMVDPEVPHRIRKALVEEYPEGKELKLYDEYKKIYGDDLDKLLNQVDEAAGYHKMPYNMAETIRTRTIQPKYDDYFAASPVGDLVLAARKGGSLVKDMTQGEFMQFLKRNGMTARDLADSKKVYKLWRESLKHELSHLASLPEPVGWSVRGYDFPELSNFPGERMDVVNKARLELLRVREDAARMGTSFSKKLADKAKMKLKQAIRQAPSKTTRKTMTYPEMIPEEITPQLSALQQYVHKTKGRILSTPEEYDAYVLPFLDMSPAEFAKATAGMPREVRRHLDNLRTMAAGAKRDPGRFNTMYDVFRKWAPGTLGVGGATGVGLGMNKEGGLLKQALQRRLG